LSDLHSIKSDAKMAMNAIRMDPVIRINPTTPDLYRIPVVHT